MKPTSRALFAAAHLVSLLPIGPAAIRAQHRPAAGPAIDMTPVAPESVGFSTERLERLHSFIQGVVDKKNSPARSPSLPATGKSSTTAPTACATSPPARP